MTKQEAKDKLSNIYMAGGTELDDALRIAIQALNDPEWIPNTGTKPECALCYVRMGDGEIDKGRPNEWDWSCRIRPDGRITHYIPIPDPPEFVEKRRYYIERYKYDGKWWWGVYDRTVKYPDGDRVAAAIPGDDAGERKAQAIADIYERMNEGQP